MSVYLNKTRKFSTKKPTTKPNKNNSTKLLSPLQTKTPPLSSGHVPNTKIQLLVKHQLQIFHSKTAKCTQMLIMWKVELPCFQIHQQCSCILHVEGHLKEHVYCYGTHSYIQDLLTLVYTRQKRNSHFIMFHTYQRIASF